MRLLCALAFGVASILTWKAGTRLGLGGAMLHALSLAAGVVAGFFGAFAGLAIPVRSSRTNYVLTVLWHYVSTGALLWIFQAGLVLQKAGTAPEPRIFYGTSAIAAGGSLLVALLLLGTRQLGQSRKPKPAACLLLAAAVAYGMTRVQTAVTPEIAPFAPFLIVAFPLALFLIASWVIARDLQARRQVAQAE